MDRQLKVLVVDDLPINNTLLKAALTTKNCLVTCATSAAEALEFIDVEKYDLAFLDVMMPKMDGNQLLERMRSNPNCDGMKIYMVSAVTTNKGIALSMSLGATGYIKKPIIITELFDIVDEIKKELAVK